MILVHNLQFTAAVWLGNVWSAKGAGGLLSPFGSLWLCIEIAEFFFHGTALPDRLRALWWLFALVGLGIATWSCRPRTSVVHKLSGRDVTIAVAIGDVFSFPGAMIVGSNTTFDTRLSTQLISKDSVQGAFTTKYYDGNETRLDSDLEAQLIDIEPEQLPGARAGKNKKYPTGTVIRLEPHQRRAYFVAIADINEHGVAVGSFRELKDSLAALWVFIGSRGIKEALVTPVLGTGFSRLTEPREEVVREIVTSFVAACSERVFTDRLTIVLSPRDVVENGISLDELGAFVRHVCLYTNFSTPDPDAVGSPI